MLKNKQELITQLTQNFSTMEDDQVADQVELELRITSNHGEVVCYDSLTVENIKLYVNVFEYAKVTEHFGTTDLNELGDYKPTDSVINNYATLIGDFGNFDGVTLTVEVKTTPYFDFSFKIKQLFK